MGKFLCRLSILACVIALLDRGGAAFLQKGLDRYYGLDRGAAVLCVGHSHTMLGIDGQRLEQGLGVPVAKYAVNGANACDRLAMIRHYLGRQPGAVRLVVYDVDDHTFTGEGLSSNSYRLFFPYLDNPDIARYLKDSVGSWEEYGVRRLLTLLRYNSVTLNLALRGTLGRYDNFKTGRVDIAALRNDLAAGRRPPITMQRPMVDAFAETVRLLRTQGVQLVLCYIPTLDLVNDADRIRHEQVLEIFKDYQAHDSGITFLDYNPAFASRYELFYDPIHLNREGQKKVTEQALTDLRQILFKPGPVER